MDIQYHIQSSSNQQVRESNPKATTIFQSSVPQVQSPPSPLKSPRHYHLPSSRVQSELEKHKLKQTQVNIITVHCMLIVLLPLLTLTKQVTSACNVSFYTGSGSNREA